MATFRILVMGHQRQTDGKFRVSVRLTHNRQSVYLPTDIYVAPKQLSKDRKTIRDAAIVRRIDRDIMQYEDILLKGLGANLSRFSAKELKAYLEKMTATERGTKIDFIAFSRQYIQNLKEAGRKSYAEGFEAVIRSLIDFFGREIVYTKEIKSKTLESYAAYLRTERTITRTNQFGKEVTVTKAPVKDRTVADYIGAIKTLFNAACEHYNDEDEEMVLISHNPFKRLHVEVSSVPRKRSISVSDLAKIIGHTGGGKREELARDVFLLSFYAIGLNTVDLYDMPADSLADGRITYKRKKTRTRRNDEAVMSLRVEPELAGLLEKYRDPKGVRVFRFYLDYTDEKGFNKAVNKGLKQLAETLGIDRNLESYCARHTWATIAQNRCGYGDSEIARALNHVGAKELKVTRGYIERDWGVVDAMNRKVLDYVEEWMFIQTRKGMGKHAFLFIK